MENKLSERNSFYIDIIRIIATVFVMFGHAFSFFQLTILKDDVHFVYIQNIGVVLLFLLAGILSAYSLQNSCKKDIEYTFGKYVSHRALRLEPELILGLIFITIVDFAIIRISPNNYGYYQNFNIKTFICNVFMIENVPEIGISDVFGTGRQIWTLPIEWWSGGLFTFLYILITKRKKVRWWELLVLLIISFEPLFYMTSGSRGAGLTIVFLFGVLVYFVLPKLYVCGEHYQAIGLAIGLLYCIVIRNAYTIYFFAYISALVLLILCGGRGKTINPSAKKMYIGSRNILMLYI